jgi:hypothetical protein
MIETRAPGNTGRVATCAHCGQPLPEGARYCPACGRPTAEVREEPVDLHVAEPRYFGLGPPVLVFSIAAALLALGIVLIVAGHVEVGALAVLVSVCLLPTFFAGARRWPEGRLARVSLSTADRLRDEAGVAVESVSTWSRASREVVQLRREQFTLRRERDAKIRELGQSVYDDDGKADELKAAAKELDDRLAANERELERTMEGARRRVRRERATIAPTEVIKPDDSSALPGEGPDDEGEPVDADHIGLDAEREDRDERGAEPGGATEGDTRQEDAPRDEREHAE